MRLRQLAGRDDLHGIGAETARDYGTDNTQCAQYRQPPHLPHQAERDSRSFFPSCGDHTHAIQAAFQLGFGNRDAARRFVAAPGRVILATPPGSYPPSSPYFPANDRLAAW